MEKTQYEYDELTRQTFLDHQLQLFPEIVAPDLEEAEYFLEDMFAVVCKNKKEVRQYFKEVGADISGMSEKELLAQSEVFPLPDGRYLIVEG